LVRWGMPASVLELLQQIPLLHHMSSCVCSL